MSATEEGLRTDFVGSVTGLWITCKGYGAATGHVRLWSSEIGALRHAHESGDRALFVRWDESVYAAARRRVHELAGDEE